MGPYLLELSLLDVIGVFEHRRLRFALWLGGFRLDPNRGSLCATVVDDRGQRLAEIRHLELPVPRIDDLATHIIATGWRERVPRVECVADTSDVFQCLELTCRWNDDRLAPWTLGFQSSGFDGPDAPAARALMRFVWQMVGADTTDESWIVDV